MTSPSSRKGDRRQRGFALLITITLLAFLVLLLVSLAALTRVETHVSTNCQQLDRARQNALLALNIALGQLQKYAGPDQRVTAPADLVADTDRLGAIPQDRHPRFSGGAQDIHPLAPTVGGSAYAPRVAVKAGSRYWTGVWGNTRVASYDLRPDSTEFTPANRGGLLPAQLGWLVSGNESASPFTANSDGSVASPSDAPAFTPALSVANLTAATRAEDDSLSIGSGPAATRAVLLVGANTLGDSSLADYVVAPTVAITASSSSIPGLGSSSTTVETGRYAWWVGDEGVKARVNLQPGYLRTGAATDQIHAFVTSQRSALEFMDRDNSTTPSPINIADEKLFNFTDARVPAALSAAQLGLLNTSSPALGSAAKARFHDLTTWSAGVLSDTYAGGLKKDLSADLAGSSARPAANDLIFPPPSGKTSTHLPTWGQLRAWPALNPASPGGVIDPSSADARAARVSPRINHLSLGMDYFLDITRLDENTYTEVRLKFALYPIVVLHNPYSLPLGPAGGSPLDLDFGVRLTRQARFIVEADHAGDKNYLHVADINLSTCTVSAVGASTAPETSFRFRVRLTAPIPPGERHVFMLQAADDDTEYLRNTPPTLVRVPQGGQSSAIKQYVWLNGPELVSTSTDSRMTNPQTRIRVRAPNLSYADSDEADSLHFTQISAVLAESNALASPTWDTSSSAQSGWHQAVQNIFPGILRMTGGDTPNGTSESKGSTFFTEIGEVWTSGEVFPADQVDSDKISLGDTLEASELTDKGMAAIHINFLHKEGNTADHIFRGAVANNYHPRFIANASVRAPFVQATRMENTPDQFLGAHGPRTIYQRKGAIIMGATIHGCGADSSAGNLADSGNNDAQLWRNSLRNESQPFGDTYFAYQSGTMNENIVTGHRHRAVLWDLLDSKDKLLSLGQLQHAFLSPWVFNSSYLVGNSVADYHVYRNTTYNDNLIVSPEGGAAQPVYDLSWLLNRQLWDKYFVSGVPSSLAQADIDAGKPLPNARLTYYRRGDTPPAVADLRQTGSSAAAYDRAAANLLVAGGFNINSTSEQAWRAVLAGTSGLPQHDSYASATDLVDTAIPYPRFSRNLAVSADAPYVAYPNPMRPDPAMANLINPSLNPDTGNASLGSTNNYVQRYYRPVLYYGNRGLFLNPNMSDADKAAASHPSPEAVVNELARCIVREVRRRGPFLSLADFINRPLTPSPSNTTQAADERLLAGIKGALQAALDKMDPDVAQANPWSLTERLEGSYPEIRYMASGNYEYINNIGLKQHLTGGYGTQDKPIKDAYGKAETHRAVNSFAPKFLTQADILSTLGPQLSARSDTFVIRTYGETRNPATATLEGRAWCEAVVQRLPDYVDSAGNNAWDAPASLNATNHAFGRHFRVVSFRWLTPDEI